MITFFHEFCGLSFVPHISTFSRVGAWFREEGIPLLHEQVLKEMHRD